MNTTQPHPADPAEETGNLEHVIHQLLVWGVALSSVLILLGLLVALMSNQPVPTSVPPLQQVLPEALALQPGGILALGLLILIATPILRVVSSIFAFLYERDWRYALITFIVFLIVLTSIYLGRG